MKIDCSTKLLEIIQNSSPLDVNLEFNGDCARYPFNVFAFDFLFSKVNNSFLSVRKKIVPLLALFSNDTQHFILFNAVTCYHQHYFDCFKKSLLRVIYHTLFQFRAKIFSNSNAKANIDGFEKRCDFYMEIFV